jgi:hypothetical protein
MKSQMLIFFSPKNAGKLRPCRAPGHTTSRSSTSLALVHALEVNEIRPLPRHVAGHGLCSCCSARVRWVGVTGIRETRSQKLFPKCCCSLPTTHRTPSLWHLRRSHPWRQAGAATATHRRQYHLLLLLSRGWPHPWHTVRISIRGRCLPPQPCP